LNGKTTPWFGRLTILCPLSDNFGESVPALTGRSTNNQEGDADEGGAVNVYNALGTDLLVRDYQGTYVTRVRCRSCKYCPESCLDGNRDGIGTIFDILTTDEHVVIVAGIYQTEYQRFEVIEAQNCTRVEIYPKPTTENLQMSLMGTKSLNVCYKGGGCICRIATPSMF
jgi:hypothetical protein